MHDALGALRSAVVIPGMNVRVGPGAAVQRCRSREQNANVKSKSSGASTGAPASRSSRVQLTLPHAATCSGTPPSAPRELPPCSRGPGLSCPSFRAPLFPHQSVAFIKFLGRLEIFKSSISSALRMKRSLEATGLRRVPRYVGEITGRFRAPWTSSSGRAPGTPSAPWRKRLLRASTKMKRAKEE